VAGGTNLNVELFAQGRAGLKLVTTAANHLDLLIFWVNIRLHDCLFKIYLKSPFHPIGGENRE
jgi:hypothetical protein